MKNPNVTLGILTLDLKLDQRSKESILQAKDSKKERN